MKKKIIWIPLLFVFLLFFINNLSCAQGTAKAGTDRQKKSNSSKILIEHISFPDVFAKYEIYPWETIAIEEFKKAYFEILASKNYEEWITTLTGTGNKNKMLHVFQKYIVMIAFCKPHFCDTKQMLIIFDPVAKKCHAVYAVDGKFDYLGTPDENMKNLLKILLVDEYREIYKGQ